MGSVSSVLNLIINARDNASAVLKGLGGAWSTLGGQLNKAGDTLIGVGAKVTAMTLPLAIFGKQSLDAAQNVQAMQLKFNAVFGNMKDSVIAWSKQTGDSLNKSEYDLQGFAAKLQNSFVNMGFATQAATGMSEQVVKLGLDLAAFNHVSDDQAINSLQMALMGSAKAMKQYGIEILPAELNQELINEGIKKGTKGANEAQLAHARLTLIMEKSGNAQGAAAKQAQTYAGEVQGLQAKLEELQVTVGEKLIPILTPLIAKVVDIIKYFSNLDSGTQTLLVKIGFFAVALGPVLIAVGTFLKALGTISSAIGFVTTSFGGFITFITGPVGLALLALVAAVIALKFAWDHNLGGIQEKSAVFMKNLRDGFEQLKTTINNVINSAPVQLFIKTVRDTLHNIIENLKKSFDTVKPKLTELTIKFQEWYIKLKPLIDLLIKFYGEVLKKVIEILAVFIVVVLKVIEVLAQLAGPAISALIDAFEWVIDTTFQLWQSVHDAFESIMDWINGKFVPAVVLAFSTMYNQIKPYVDAFVLYISVAWDFIVSVIVPAIQFIVQKVTEGFNMVKDVIASVFSAIMNNIVGPVVNWFMSNIWPTIDHFIQNIVGGFNWLRDQVGNAFNWIRDKASVIWNGIANSISGIWGGVVSAVKGGINWVIDQINNFASRINGLIDTANNIGKNIPGYINIGFRIGNIPHLAQGGEFVVPQGYNNDNFPMFVQSGEKVKVTPANQVGKGDDTKTVINHNEKTVNMGGITVYNNSDMQQLVQILNYYL